MQIYAATCWLMPRPLSDVQAHVVLWSHASVQAHTIHVLDLMHSSNYFAIILEAYNQQRTQWSING